MTATMSLPYDSTQTQHSMLRSLQLCSSNACTNLEEESAMNLPVLVFMVFMKAEEVNQTNANL